MTRRPIKLTVWTLAFVTAAVVLTSCSGTAHAPSSGPSTANSSTPAPPKEPEGGKIEVSSTPPGAAVMLILSDEDGASPPLPKGSTPTTLVGLSPGKYVVHLEKPGYRFSQKEVEIKSTETVKVDLKLRRE
jgi:hypothetical protein